MRTYRASSLGYSLEALVAPHLGYVPVSPPEFIQERFDEGHRLEPIVIEKLRDMGWVIQTTQDEINAVGDYQIEVELEIIPGVARVVGHLDGLVTDTDSGDSAILEVKSMAHKSFLAWKNKGWHEGGSLIEKYKWQASALMLATGLPHCLVAWDKETEEICFYAVIEPFYTISDIANKLQAAEDAISDGVLPEGCTDFPCPYFYLHTDKESVPVAKADEVLEITLASWLDADRAEKAAKKLKDEYKRLILAQTGTDEAGVAGKIQSACGVTVSTRWQEETFVSGYTKKAGWVTSIQGPRNAAK